MDIALWFSVTEKRPKSKQALARIKAAELEADADFLNGLAAGADFKTSKPRSSASWAGSNPGTQPAGSAKSGATPYTDPDGSLLFESVRYLKPDGNKTFIQVRPSGVDAAGTTDPKRIGGVPIGGIIVGLSNGKCLHRLPALHLPAHLPHAPGGAHEAVTRSPRPMSCASRPESRGIVPQ